MLHAEQLLLSLIVTFQDGQAAAAQSRLTRKIKGLPHDLAADQAQVSRLCLLFAEALHTLQVNDTVLLDLETGKIKEFTRFELGNLCMVTGGANNGYATSSLP